MLDIATVSADIRLTLKSIESVLSRYPWSVVRRFLMAVGTDDSVARAGESFVTYTSKVWAHEDAQYGWIIRFQVDAQSGRTGSVLKLCKFNDGGLWEPLEENDNPQAKRFLMNEAQAFLTSLLRRVQTHSFASCIAVAPSGQPAAYSW